jgi:hypothetical protein
MHDNMYLLSVLWEWIDTLELSNLYRAYNIHDYTVFQAIDIKSKDVFQFPTLTEEYWSSRKEGILMQLESSVGFDIQDSVLSKTVTYSVLSKESYPINLLSDPDPWKLRAGVRVFQDSVNCVTQ